MTPHLFSCIRIVHDAQARAARAFYGQGHNRAQHPPPRWGVRELGPGVDLDSDLRGGERAQCMRRDVSQKAGNFALLRMGDENDHARSDSDETSFFREAKSEAKSEASRSQLIQEWVASTTALQRACISS